MDGQISTKLKGWNAKWIKRFNKLGGSIWTFRRTAVCMELESVLKERYVELCGMTDEIDGNSGDESWNSKDNDNGSIDRYNGFICDDVIAHEINIAGF